MLLSISIIFFTSIILFLILSYCVEEPSYIFLFESIHSGYIVYSFSDTRDLLKHIIISKLYYHFVVRVLIGTHFEFLIVLNLNSKTGRRMYKFLFLLLVTSIILFNCADDQPTEPKNNAPQIKSITASPASIKVNETTSLTCVATDADGNDLTITWSCENGTFPNGASGASVNWKAPSENGTYNIAVTVSDGKETADSEKEIVVEKKEIPILEITPQSLEFDSDKTQSKFSITSSTGSLITYNITDDMDWITVTPISGGVETETDEIAVTIDSTGLPEGLTTGEYKGQVTITYDTTNIKVDVTLTIPEKLGAIEGFVTDINTNDPIGEVLLEIDNRFTMTANDGSYRIDSVSIGTQTIKATKADYQIYEQTVTITESQTTEYDINIAAFRSISGIIRSKETQEPISGVKIIINLKAVYTDAGGYYQFGGLTQGTHSIEAEKDKFLSSLGEITLSYEDRTYDITLEYAYTKLSGVVKDSDTGELLNNIKISIDGKENYTDASGYYEFPVLNKGTQSITAVAEDSTYKFYTDQIELDSIEKTYNIILAKVCGGITTVTYAGKTYNTVQIGDQCWLKENLNVGTMIQSTTNVFQQKDNSIIEKYCYNNDAANCDVYGGLYEWTEAMQYVTREGTQGICPDSWHIPTKGEYESLESYVKNLATKLIDENAKSGYTFTNETGFSALFSGSFDNGKLGNMNPKFWISTEESKTIVYYMFLDADRPGVYFSTSYREYGYSIRCLKD